MSESFNLTTEPWLLATAPDGRTREVALREAFLDAHAIRSVTLGNPPADAGLWRVLVAITYRITGLDDPGRSLSDWLARRNAALARGHFDPDATGAYLDAWEHRFDLFDPEHPFLQDPRLWEQCKARGIAKLIPGRPINDGLAWFEHAYDSDPIPVAPAEALAGVLVWLYYGPGGSVAGRTCVDADGTTVSDRYGREGPVRDSVTYLPDGGDLFTSLVASLTYPGHVANLEPTKDLAPWETELPNPLDLAPAPWGPVTALVGQFRHAAVLKAVDGQVVDASWTWQYRGDPVRAIDPFLIYRVPTEKSPHLVTPRVDLGRAVWRDLEAILVPNPGLVSPTADHLIRPVVFADAAGLPDEVLERLGIRALAFSQDRGNVRDLGWTRSSTPAVLHFLAERDPAAALAAGNLLERARRSGDHLDASLKRAAPEGSVATGAWRNDAANRYWRLAEEEFWTALNGRDGAGAEMNHNFRTIARQIYDGITAPYATNRRFAALVQENRP